MEGTFADVTGFSLRGLDFSAFIERCMCIRGAGSNLTVPFSRFKTPIAYLY